MGPFSVLGMGPGGEEYLLPLARKRIDEAAVLVGAPRHIKPYEGGDKTIFPLRSNWDEAVKFIEERRVREKVCVLVSGDPCLFSYLSVLKKKFPPEEIEIIPGISSFQLLAAKTAFVWNGAAVVSAHGRGVEKVTEAFHSHTRLVVFTDTTNTPEKIAASLSAAGFGDETVILGKNLGYEDEKIGKLTVAECAGHRIPDKRLSGGQHGSCHPLDMQTTGIESPGRFDGENDLWIMILEKNGGPSTASE